MVSNLNYKSHPNKNLEVHISGVVEKCRKCTSLPVAIVAAFFHDLGKINPNFQIMLKGISNGKYSKHSYLSVISLFNYLKENEKQCKDLLQAKSNDDFRIKIIQTAALIAHHHGNLPDFEFLLNKDELIIANNFLSNNSMPVSDFMTQNLSFKHNSFTNASVGKQFNAICNYIPYIHDKIWEQDALNYFMDTQFAFAALIQSDKIDASEYSRSLFHDEISSSKQRIEEVLKKTFVDFDASQKPLNKLRTSIRLESVEKLTKILDTNKRVFTLTAPTGAGKTFTLLALANEIQKRGDYGIVYALPFLSITDQVQNILQKLKIGYLPISSKSQNKKAEKAYKIYEQSPTPENLEAILQSSFAEEIFDHPFIVTTFVQIFETLVSNHNSVLLKLPNFAKRIFLIDEIQVLPPRLYVFFAALIEAFCRKNDSYAILATATMPKFVFPQKGNVIPNEKRPDILFKDYTKNQPIDLCDPLKYFFQDVFNRYKITLINEDKFTIKELAQHVRSQEKSCLIILNTIGDTKLLFNELCDEKNIILLNTHFIPVDRTNKIRKVTEILAKNKKVVLISTQLIEAGVDIDFPIIYRDLCPLPNLIQSAGRCNRNKTLEYGTVYFFKLCKEHGKASSEIVYGKDAAQFLDFSKNKIVKDIKEKDLFNLQSEFFEYLKNNLSVGDFEYNEHKANMIECINKARFESLGNFKLIDEHTFGEQYCYYIPKNENDHSYDDLVYLMKQSLHYEKYNKERKLCKNRINGMLKLMSDRMLNIRINSKQNAPNFSNGEEYFGIRVLADLNRYSSITGLDLGTNNLLL
jgi:CRISPR-associated endonuclease/helicase Cas3